MQLLCDRDAPISRGLMRPSLETIRNFEFRVERRDFRGMNAITESTKEEGDPMGRHEKLPNLTETDSEDGLDFSGQ